MFSFAYLNYGTRYINALLLVVFGFFAGPVNAAYHHFENWFPQYRSHFSEVLRDNCSDEFALYLTDDPPPRCHGRPACLVGDVLNCVLSNSRQSVLSNTASASVVLGVLPTTLAMLERGSMTTVEIALLARRRPLLALLLAIGNPAISPAHTADYGRPELVLMHDGVRLWGDTGFFSNMSRVRVAALTAAQYFVALASMVNIAHLSYELCYWTLCSFNPETFFHPALWAVLAVLIHALGTFAVWMWSGMKMRGSETESPRLSMWRRIGLEFTPSGLHPQSILYTRPSRQKHGQHQSLRGESMGRLAFVFLSWLLSTGTVVHIVYGTLVFSSIQFISAQDAAAVVTRYLLSMAACRVVRLLEISGMQATVLVVSGETIEEGHRPDGDVTKVPVHIRNEYSMDDISMTSR